MARKSTTPTPSDPDTGGAITLNQAKGQARHIADRTLREAHQTEWNGYFQQQLKARNVEWSPKPTQEELDLAQLHELVEKYPNAVHEWVDAHDWEEHGVRADEAGASGDPSL